MKKIKLTQGKYALVDDDEVENISRYSWRAVKDDERWYAVTNIRYGLIISMHRMIIGAKKGEIVDHINGKGLDNRRKNLRICTPKENSRNKAKRKDNKSGFTGVSWIPNAKKWRAQCSANKTHTSLGLFSTKLKARKKYLEFIRKEYKEFARQ